MPRRRDDKELEESDEKKKKKKEKEEKKKKKKKSKKRRRRKRRNETIFSLRKRLAVTAASTDRSPTPNGDDGTGESDEHKEVERSFLLSRRLTTLALSS